MHGRPYPSLPRCLPPSPPSISPSLPLYLSPPLSLYPSLSFSLSPSVSGRGFLWIGGLGWIGLSTAWIGGLSRPLAHSANSCMQPPLSHAACHGAASLRPQPLPLAAAARGMRDGQSKSLSSGEPAAKSCSSDPCSSDSCSRLFLRRSTICRSSLLFSRSSRIPLTSVYCQFSEFHVVFAA